MLPTTPLYDDDQELLPERMAMLLLRLALAEALSTVIEGDRAEEERATPEIPPTGADGWS